LIILISYWFLAIVRGGKCAWTSAGYADLTCELLPNEAVKLRNILMMMMKLPI